MSARQLLRSYVTILTTFSLLLTMNFARNSIDMLHILMWHLLLLFLCGAGLYAFTTNSFVYDILGQRRYIRQEIAEFLFWFFNLAALLVLTTIVYYQLTDETKNAITSMQTNFGILLVLPVVIWFARLPIVAFIRQHRLKQSWREAWSFAWNSGSLVLLIVNMIRWFVLIELVYKLTNVWRLFESFPAMPQRPILPSDSIVASAFSLAVNACFLYGPEVARFFIMLAPVYFVYLTCKYSMKFGRDIYNAFTPDENQAYSNYEVMAALFEQILSSLLRFINKRSEKIEKASV